LFLKILGSERMIGDVLRELEKEGISREEIVVSTKVEEHKAFF